ncbi:MAG: type II toxin-antitoxin system VapC family toxin [Chloroflexi bacterium]|nr:type II toxin-antitoxin system VapC family toxin [Chloroflexota bacterium]
MTVFIDTAVFVYATGAEHRFRAPCTEVVHRVETGRLRAATSVEVIQEILHRSRSIGRSESGVRLARATLDAFGPVLPVTHTVMARVPSLVERYPGLATRDLVHVATCLEEGIDTIVTTDQAMSQIREVRCIHPSQLATDA